MKMFIKAYNKLIFEDVLLEGKCEVIYKAQQETQTDSSTPPPTGKSTDSNTVDAEIVD